MQNPSQAATAAATAAAIATAAVGFSEPVLFGLVWVSSALAALARFTTDNDYRSISRLVAGSASAGFLAFALIAILRFSSEWDSSADFLCMGIAMLVGGLGKKQEKLRQWAVNKVFGIDQKEEK